MADPIECADSAEGEREAGNEKESEKEGVDDEFIGIHAFGQNEKIKKINSKRTHFYYHSNAYIVIITPPPKLA